MERIAKTRWRTRAVISLAAALMLSAALPAVGAPPGPFIGAWEANLDGTIVRLHLGGNGHYHLYAPASAFCDGAASTMLGTFEPDQSDPASVLVTADVYCHYTDGRRYYNSFRFRIADGEDGTLRSQVCWYRPGSDPTACDST